MQYVLRALADKKQAFEFELAPSGELAIGKQRRPLRVLRRDANGLFTVLWGDEVLSGVLICSGDRGEQLEVLAEGQIVKLQLRTATIDRMEQGLAAAHGVESSIEVISPIPGLVKAVLVKVGDTVTAGQHIVVLEAMKMENEIVAPHAGVVEIIDAKAGSAVAAGALLLKIKNGI